MNWYHIKPLIIMKITDVFDFYLSQFADIHMAEDNFRDELEGDPELRQQYKDWCDEMGYSERIGFRCYNINRAEAESIWDEIYPNAEELDGYDFGRR